jgi:molybdenum cofactor synthesis domain-containing protein
MTITHEEALALIRERTPLLDAVEAPLMDCAGRRLARDVAARVSSPPFDKSAMDGYAVRAADAARLPARLKLAGACFAGGWPEFEVGEGECAEIATGAPVPPGADMVVMVEHTRRDGDTVIVEKLTGKNICLTGEDMREGERVLREGDLITPLRIGVAAAAGHGRLPVCGRPSVALVCTGEEIVEPPAPVAPGRIYNSNGPLLRSLLASEGLEVAYLGIVGDDAEALARAVTRGLEHDLLIITGGVSVGPFDLVPRTLEKLGVETIFHGVAIKPGKPALFGLRGRSCVFGMPGNPFSCFAIFHVLLRTAIARMQGVEDTPPHYRKGLVTMGFEDRGARKTFKPCRLVSQDGRVGLDLIPTSGSADIRHAAEADALLVVPMGMERAEAGREMEYITL